MFRLKKNKQTSKQNKKTTPPHLLHSSELGERTLFPSANHNEHHVSISLYVENLSPGSVTQRFPSLASKQIHLTEEINSNGKE